MPFLRSLFGKTVADAPPTERLDEPPIDPAVMEAAVSTLRAFWSDVQRLCPDAFGSDKPGLTALSVYAYGGLVVLTEQHGYLPSHRREIYRALLRDFFAPLEEIGNAREAACRRQASQPTSNFYPIIQRGIPAFRAWQEHRESFDAADFRSLISARPWRLPESPNYALQRSRAKRWPDHR